ncbi:MAG: hypothetical protein HQK83_07095 [Fibrobacteria bacterium]|nr:hypothetical protein [Fibrobacteria bacterium]
MTQKEGRKATNKKDSNYRGLASVVIRRGKKSAHLEIHLLDSNYCANAIFPEIGLGILNEYLNLLKKDILLPVVHLVRNKNGKTEFIDVNSVLKEFKEMGKYVPPNMRYSQPKFLLID